MYIWDNFYQETYQDKNAWLIKKVDNLLVPKQIVISSSASRSSSPQNLISFCFFFLFSYASSSTLYPRQ